VLGARADSFTTHHQKLTHNAGSAVATVSLHDLGDKPVVAAVRLRGWVAARESPRVMEAASPGAARDEATGVRRSEGPYLQLHGLFNVSYTV
jgi:hypothetical protein